MNYLSLELRKTKRRGMWLVIAVLLAVLLLWTVYAVNYDNFPDFGWKILLYNTPLLNAIMIPTGIAVFASRSIDMEHKGNMWKMLETMQSKRQLYLTKLLYGLLGIFLFSLAELAGLLLLGKLLDFRNSPDIWAYVLLFVQTFLITSNLFLLQMIISLLFTNQAVALCVGLCGSMAGLFLMYLPQCPLIRCLLPWGHYGASMFVGMDWNEETKKIVGFYYFNQDNNAMFFIIGWFLFLIIVGWLSFKNMDTDGYSFQNLIRKKSKTPSRKRSVQIPCVPIELIKVRRTPIWLAFLGLPLISAVIGTANYLNNLEILKSSWYSLWTQHSLFFSYIFLPPLIGVYASYVWHLEHSGTNWNMLLVNSSAYRIVFGKIATCAVIAFFTVIWLGILFVACGLYAGITEPIPIELIDWLVCGFIGSVSVCAIQCFLSLCIRSFALPIGLALLGGVSGLIVTAKGFEYALPYTLLSVGLRANNPNRALNYNTFLTSSVIFILLFYLLSVDYIRLRDTKTQG